MVLAEEASFPFDPAWATAARAFAGQPVRKHSC
jgi:hypothetical protein